MNDHGSSTSDHGPGRADDHASAIDSRWSVIELEIGELVLHGFAPGDRGQIGEVVERELARLLGERPPPNWSQSDGATRLDGGAFEVAQGTGAEAIGAQIARALYAAIGGATEL